MYLWIIFALTTDKLVLTFTTATATTTTLLSHFYIKCKYYAINAGLCARILFNGAKLTNTVRVLGHTLAWARLSGGRGGGEGGLVPCEPSPG